MFKILECFLLLKGVCNNLDDEIKDFKGITYRNVVHFMCSIPYPRHKRVLSDLTIIRENNGNFEFFFNNYVVLYAVTMQSLSIKKDRDHNLLTIKTRQHEQLKA